MKINIMRNTLAKDTLCEYVKRNMLKACELRNDSE